MAHYKYLAIFVETKQLNGNYELVVLLRLNVKSDSVYQQQKHSRDKKTIKETRFTCKVVILLVLIMVLMLRQIPRALGIKPLVSEQGSGLDILYYQFDVYVQQQFYISLLLAHGL